MFRAHPLSIIRSFSLYTQQWYMSYSLRAGSERDQFRPDPARKLSANMYDINRYCVYSEKTPSDGNRNCPKHVEFYSKNKCEKLMHLVGFIIRILIHGMNCKHFKYHVSTLRQETSKNICFLLNEPNY